MFSRKVGLRDLILWYLNLIWFITLTKNVLYLSTDGNTTTDLAVPLEVEGDDVELLKWMVKLFVIKRSLCNSVVLSLWNLVHCTLFFLQIHHQNWQECSWVQKSLSFYCKRKNSSRWHCVLNQKGEGLSNSIQGKVIHCVAKTGSDTSTSTMVLLVDQGINQATC